MLKNYRFFKNLFCEVILKLEEEQAQQFDDILANFLRLSSAVNLVKYVNK